MDCSCYKCYKCFLKTTEVFSNATLFSGPLKCFDSYFPSLFVDMFWCPSMKVCKWGNSQCDQMAKLFKSIWPSTTTKTCPIIKDFCHSRIKILPNKNNIPQKLPKTFKILPKFAKSGHSGVARSIRFASNICKSILADSVQLSFKCHYLFISLGKNSFKTFISKFFLSFCVRRSVFSTSRITN